MRIVFDSNALISAFITTEGIASRVLLRSLEGHEVLLSGYILREFKEKLIRKLKYPDPLVETFVRFLELRAKILTDEAAPARGAGFSDPKDIPILHFLEEQFGFLGGSAAVTDLIFYFNR